MGLALARPAQARREPRRRIVVPNSVHPVCDVYAHQQAVSIRLESPRPRSSESWRARRGLGLLLSRFIRYSMSSGRVARCDFLDYRIVSRNCLTGTEIAGISATGLPCDPLASSTFVFAGSVKPFTSRDCIVPPQRGQCWLDQSLEASINC